MEKNPSHKGGVIAGARQWKKDQINFLKNYYILEQLGKAYLIKYEELISDTSKKLKEICEFLEIPYDASMVEFYKDSLTKINATKQIAWSNLSKKIIRENKNKYKKELSEEEILCIEKICFHEMIYFDYQLENTLSEIESFEDSRLVELEKKERLIKNQKIIEGVQKNMEAKKVFYNKVIL